MKRMLFLSLMFLLFTGCCYEEPLFDDNAYKVEQSSAAVGDTVEVRCSGVYSCGTTSWGLSHSLCGVFSGLAAINNLYSEDSIPVRTGDFSEIDRYFEVPPKAISSNALFGKPLRIEYPEILTITKNGNKVTVKSEKAFFNIDTFSKEKAKLLLDNTYPMIWLNGNNPDVQLRNFENMSPLQDSSSYDLETITPYQVTFTIPDWAENGIIHIINENGYLLSEWDTTPLGDVEIDAADFEEILSKISEDDKEFIQSKYHLKYGVVYILNDGVPTGENLKDNRDETYKNIKRILRQSGYYDTHVPNIEPDPFDPDAFFASKEKLIIK